MKNKKIRKRPKSKKNLRQSKRRLARYLKIIRKKSNVPKPPSTNGEDPDFIGMIKGSSGLWTFDLKNSQFNGVHPEYFRLQDFDWIGLITLKFHSLTHSKDDSHGHKNRFNFLAPFMNNLRIKLGLSDREFIWVACEEFGFTGAGHLHVMFSFDELKEKDRLDKLKIADFSENGEFWNKGQESIEYISQTLGINPRTVDFNWRPMWENEGLVAYFCKKEFGREEKFIEFSDYWKKHGISKAA